MTGTDLALLFSSSCEDRAAREALAGILRAMKAPVEVDGVRFRISTNCGVACYPTDGTDRDELIMKANLALYQAKKSGGSVVRFNAQIGQSVMRRTRIRNALLKALEHREFELYYQPQIELQRAG
jgi:predicted signal transduction protein with EAL and GGDEF domain